MSDLNAWYYRLMGDVVGPVTSKSLRELAKSGGIDFDTQVRKGTDGDWVSAASIKGLFPDEPYVPPQVSTQPPEFAPSAEIQKTPIAQQKQVEPTRKAVDRKLPSSVELLSFNLVRIAMMLFASLAILTTLWFGILILFNQEMFKSNVPNPSTYAQIKTQSMAEQAEMKRASESKAVDLVPDDATLINVVGIPFGVPRRLRGLFNDRPTDSFFNDRLTEGIYRIYESVNQRHLRAAWSELKEFLGQIDTDKDLNDLKLAKDMIYSFCRGQAERFQDFDSRETDRKAALVGGWSGLTMSFLMLVGVVLVLVLLAIERNTRSAA